MRQKLLAAYRTMDAYPEVAEVLAGSEGRGASWRSCRTATRTCSTTPCAAPSSTNLFDAVLSVTAAGIFKPAPAVYTLATERFGCKPGDISFQSSNRWDIAGAKAFGFHCVWINRTGAPDEYPDLRPDRIVRDLRGLLA